MSSLPNLLFLFPGLCLLSFNTFSQINIDSCHNYKIDSIIKVMVNLDGFPNSRLYPLLKNHDVNTNLTKYIPLSKKVYYPDIDLTIEYRKTNNSHDNVELIICYNKHGYASIPFYWQYDLYGNAKFVDDFEIKLNEAILLFFSHLEINFNYSLYQLHFTRQILENISSYRFHLIYKEDIDCLIKKTESFIDEGFFNFDSTKCKPLAIDNLKKLYEQKCNNDCELYLFPINHTLFRFEYSDNGVIFSIINEACFWELKF